MPRRARALENEYYFHVINRSVRRAPIFLRPKDYREFLEILREGLARHQVPLVAYCILPNHWHLVLGRTGTTQLSRLMHWVTTTHAVRLHTRRRTVGEGPIYQGRFKAHAIESSGALLRVCRYVERNALSSQLVRRAQDWPWGSLRDRLRPESAVPLAGAPFLASDAWIEHVNAGYAKDHSSARPVPNLWKPVENEPVPSVDAADDPGGFGGGVKGRQERVGVRRRAGQHQAHPHVERAKHLRLVQLPGPLKPGEERRNRPTAAVK